MAIDLKIVNDGDWGGYIPVMLRDDKATIQIGKNLKLTFEGEDFAELRKVFAERIQKRFNDAQIIVKRYDTQAEIVRKFYDGLKEIGLQTDAFVMFDETSLSEDKTSKLELLIVEFYNAFWGNREEQTKYLEKNPQKV